jgi:hypothetical protein
MQGDRVRIMDVPQFRALLRALEKIGKELETLNKNLGNTEEDDGSS